ncbi:MAG TPA: hypothetical protein VGO62_03050 [Myxococcota bacterium]
MADKKKKSDQTMTNMDRRIVERSVSRGTIKQADVDAHMKGLVDLEDRADNIADKVYPADKN